MVVAYNSRTREVSESDISKSSHHENTTPLALVFF